MILGQVAVSRRGERVRPSFTVDAIRRLATLLGLVLLPAPVAVPDPLVSQEMPTFGTVQPDTKLFDYDPATPLEVERGRTTLRDGYRRTEVSWRSPDGGRVPAWIYVPEGDGPTPRS